MKTLQPTPTFDRGDRTYHVSDERLKAFAHRKRERGAQLCLDLVRLAQAAKAQMAPQPR